MSGKENRRAPRIRILPLHDLSIAMVEPSAVLGIRIANLSVTGAGLIKESSQTWPEAGQRFSGKMKFGEKTVDMVARVVGIYPRVVGVQFEGDSEELRTMILEFFKVELSAVSMIEVNPKILKQPKEGKARYFCSENACELNIVEDDSGGLLRFDLSFLGNYFESENDGSLKYGVAQGDEKDVDENTGNYTYKGSTIINWSPLSNEMIETAVRFVNGIETLDELSRDEINSRLDDGRL